ncbi:MAG: hypothetical protein IPN80_05565 [Flavobacterium sp.]|nr:hypothetical protein [Flavobacterium sp.]
MRTIKLISGIALMVILSIACSSSSDSSDSAPSCESLSNATDAAEAAYYTATAANLAERCAAYKTALQNEINSCGDASGDLQDTFNDLSDCNIGPVNSSVISVKVGSVIKTYETNVTVTTVGPNLEIRAYDNATATDNIFFKIPVGTTGANKISNFNLRLLSSDYNPLSEAEGGNWTSNISVNSATTITGTFFGIVTSPTTGADLDLTQGTINISL